MLFIKCILLCLLCICLYSCEERHFIKNKYYIEKASIRFVDYLGKDSRGCALISDFSPEAQNEYCGIALKLDKHFYSDSTIISSTKPANWGRGASGTEELIDSINIRLKNEQFELDITRLLEGSVDKNYIHPDSIVNSSAWSDRKFPCAPEPFGCSCVKTLLFDDINDLVNSYNSDDAGIDPNKITKGEALHAELFFWMQKDSLMQKVEKPVFTTELVISFKDANKIIRVKQESGVPPQE